MYLNIITIELTVKNDCHLVQSKLLRQTNTDKSNWSHHKFIKYLYISRKFLAWDINFITLTKLAVYSLLHVSHKGWTRIIWGHGCSIVSIFLLVLLNLCKSICFKSRFAGKNLLNRNGEMIQQPCTCSSLPFLMSHPTTTTTQVI